MLEARAKHFVEVQSVKELIKVLQWEDYAAKFVLGGGSNMLILGISGSPRKENKSGVNKLVNTV